MSTLAATLSTSTDKEDVIGMPVRFEKPSLQQYDSLDIPDHEIMLLRVEIAIKDSCEVDERAEKSIPDNEARRMLCS